MLSRSLGEAPRSAVSQMRMPSPSGYCGAMSWMRQIGTRNNPASTTAAAAVRKRSSRDIMGVGPEARESGGRVEIEGGAASHAAPPLAVIRWCASLAGVAAHRVRTHLRRGRDGAEAPGLRLCGPAGVRAQRHVRSRRGDADVALHLLVQRGAE